MARILKLSKHAAHIFIQNISASDQQRDLLTTMKFRRISKRFRECFPDYHAKILEYMREHDNAMMTYPRDTPEWYEAIRRFNKNVYDLSHSEGLEPARDEHNDGILVETEDFRFLSDKFKQLKGLPTEGEAGDTWEEIYEAFESAVDTKIKAVSKEETSA